MNVIQLIKDIKLSDDPITKLSDEMKSISYDNSKSDEKYIIKSPDQLLKTKKGICYDQVELEREVLTKIGYTFKTYFAYAGLPITDNFTHTFLIFKEKHKYYWFENSWVSYRGIHGSFLSYDIAIKYVSKQLKLSSKWKHVHIVPYLKFNYTGMNINQFGETLLKKFIAFKL